ncbi:MAG: hypothetical protein V2A69_05465 [Pseudomonadota bacterium]
MGAVIFIIFGVGSFLRYWNYHTLELQTRNLQQEIRAGDSILDPHQALTHYQKLKPMAPEVQLRILQRQWLIALGILHQIQLTKRNPFLEKDIPELYHSLNTHLDQMNDGCNVILTESEPLSEKATWRVYNIRGSVKLLMAFSILETERNWKKVIGIMKEAISDLKSAIASVDKTNITTFEKNIPRWNLELLQGEQFVKKFEYTTIADDQRLELKDNLEAIIPERGGYAPGEPMERRILK